MRVGNLGIGKIRLYITCICDDNYYLHKYNHIYYELLETS